MFEATADGVVKLKSTSTGDLLQAKFSSLDTPFEFASGDVLKLLSVASEASGRAAESIRAAAMRLHDNTKDSQSVTITELRDNPNEVSKRTIRAMQLAEIDRYDCQCKWTQLCVTSQRLAVKIQVVLTKIQESQERFISIITDCLKKIIVFESSAIANIQYDIQMLFKVFMTLLTSFVI